MPRLLPHLIATARSQHPLLPLLLQQTRTLPLAHAELRWLREYVSELPYLTPRRQYDYLKRLCRRRSLGVPLQYLLKTQPFGDVDILCGSGALIPRPETEETVLRFLNGLKSHLHSHSSNNDIDTHDQKNENAEENIHCIPKDRELRVLDLCTGPGSIALLAASNLHALHLPRGFRVLGVDISAPALTLARRSLRYNIVRGTLPTTIEDTISFLTADLLAADNHAYNAIAEHFTNNSQFAISKEEKEGDAVVDIVIANPPYVSLEGYWKTTARSVRLYEPEIALVPPACDNLEDTLRQDMFYPAIERLSQKFGAQALVLETGGDEQSARVKSMLEQRGWRTSVWMDFAGIKRNVVAWRAHSWSWLAEPSNTF
ncbi:hypothetical protein ABW21_db0204416 [Orbilia brochopaga]|nr:hypothetical protein ABW21_db0204416 [Drechslerella brochopaga]